MSIIGKVGRKSLKMRTLHSLIHIVLIVGSITMIYPFMLMLSSSIKSAVDNNKVTLIPEYLYKDEVLFQKYLEARYNEESNRLADNYAGRFMSFNEVQLPVTPNPEIYADWKDFINIHSQEFGVYDYYVSEQYGRGVYPKNQRLIRAQLRKENHNDLTEFNNKYGLGVQTWEEIVVEEKDILTRNYISSGSGYLGRYEKFKQEVPLWHRNYINIDGSFTLSELIPAYQGDLTAFNLDMGTQYTAWSEVILPATVPDDSSKLRPYWIHFVQKSLNVEHVAFTPEYTRQIQHELAKQASSGGDIDKKAWDPTYIIENQAAPEDLQVKSINLRFRQNLQAKYGSIAALNQAWKLGYHSFSELIPPSVVPGDNIKARQDWLQFIQQEERHEVVIKPAAQQDFINYLKLSYALPDSSLDVDAVNRALGTEFDSELNVYPAKNQPSHPRYHQLWDSFLKQVNPAHLELNVYGGVISAYQRFLHRKYKSILALNEEWGLLYKSFDSVPLPVGQIEYFTLLEHKAAIRWEFISRNYVMVLDQMIHDSRSLRNTFWYCLLSILLAITVNPLAAYALSRFKPKMTYQVIMLFMLTMAFPAMVMGIPNFLMLKKMGMLNTFWALVLPAAADGYFIFLLKGFFDSLPKELYESARLDGAGEFRLFWQFTLYLSKPILAVIALGAFNAAYRNFLFAFIVCQDQSMWTLMVHIYELMQRASASVGYAALVIAAIPTLLVFVFFQNIIIKGIVVPMEK